MGLIKSIIPSNLFALLIGSILTLITTLLINKSNVKNSLDEKISDEKVKAYKAIYQLICKLNAYVSPAADVIIPEDCFIGYNNNGYHKEYSFPNIFIEFSVYNEYKLLFSRLLNENRLYLSQSILNKLSFLDGYLSQIWHISYNKDPGFLHKIGFTLSNEIEELHLDIENDIRHFFNSKKTHKSENKLSLAYKFEIEKYKKTDLYNYYIKDSNFNKLGYFKLCSNCSHFSKCPLEKLESNDK